MIAFDPGRVTLLEGVEKLPDGSIRRHRLTKKQYYQDSHINRANKNVKNWNREIEGINQEMSAKTYRTPDIEEFLQYVQVVEQHNDILWEHLTQKKYGRNRFDVYVHKTKCIDKFFQSLQQPGEAEARYCLWCFENLIRMVLERSLLLLPHCRNVVLNITKQRWSMSSERPKYVASVRNHWINCIERWIRRQGIVEESLGLEKRNGNEIRGLRWCSTKCHKFQSRDLNAALNILKIATSEIRPAKIE